MQIIIFRGLQGNTIEVCSIKMISFWQVSIWLASIYTWFRTPVAQIQHVWFYQVLVWCVRELCIVCLERLWQPEHLCHSNHDVAVLTNQRAPLNSRCERTVLSRDFRFRPTAIANTYLVSIFFFIVNKRSLRISPIEMDCCHDYLSARAFCSRSSWLFGVVSVRVVLSFRLDCFAFSWDRHYFGRHRE